MHKLSIATLAIIISGCSYQPISPTSTDEATKPDSLPSGFAVVDRDPNGYYVCLASTDRATPGAIDSIAKAFGDKYDRINICLEPASQRGEEYIAIIGDQIFDYTTDHIYSLYTVSQPSKNQQ